MDELTRNVRSGFRSLLRSPGFTVVAVVTVALGVGVNSSIFSVVNAVLLRPLPVERPEELVDIYGHSATASTHDSNSYPNFLDYRSRAETLSGLIAYTNFFANLSVNGSAELVVGELVSEDYFAVLGVEPALGRAFSPEEFQAPGAGPVAVLSHGFWHSRFGGDPDVVGGTLRLNGSVYTIVGVAPQRFGGMFPAVAAQMWIPVSMVESVEPLGNTRVTGPGSGDTRLTRRGSHFLWVKGRMRPGVTVAQVSAELEAIAAALSAEYPDTNENERVTILATRDVAINPDFDRTLAPAGAVLMGAVGLVLLVACANLANMMLARAASRRRELAVRAALGAGRGRLVGQLLTESLLLAVAGGLAAFGLSAWLSRVVAGLQPPLPIELGLDLSPDWRVLAFTLSVAAATGILFGLVPAVRASRPDLVPALKDGGEIDASGRRRIEVRDGLVVVQVALSVVLVVAGSLMVRSLGAAGEVEFGYEPDRTAFLGLAMEMNGYDAAAAGLFFEEGRRRLAQVPGIEAVGLTSRIPLSLNNNGFGVVIEGHQTSSTDAPYAVDGAYVDERYLDALGLELLEGRGIRPEDRTADMRVAVVTRTMATRLWPGESAVGREFRLGWAGAPVQVVGVMADHRVDSPGEDAKPYLLLPLPLNSVFANFVVRTTGDAGTAVGPLERELRTLNPELVFLDTGTLQDLADVRLFPVRAGAWLIGVFGGLALFLAAVGLYGVIGYGVSRRVREIGIRKALGATQPSVVALVLRRGVVLVGAGFVLGAVLAAVSARFLAAVLFVSPWDLPSFLTALAVLSAAAVLAYLVPARKAANVEPATAFRAS